MMFLQNFKIYEPVEAYYMDCNTFHFTYGEVSGNSDFPVAICPQCEANWNEYLDMIKETD